MRVCVCVLIYTYNIYIHICVIYILYLDYVIYIYMCVCVLNIIYIYMCVLYTISRLSYMILYVNILQKLRHHSGCCCWPSHASPRSVASELSLPAQATTRHWCSPRVRHVDLDVRGSRPSWSRTSETARNPTQIWSDQSWTRRLRRNTAADSSDDCWRWSPNPILDHASQGAVGIC